MVSFTYQLSANDISCQLIFWTLKQQGTPALFPTHVTESLVNVPADLLYWLAKSHIEREVKVEPGHMFGSQGLNQLSRKYPWKHRVDRTSKLFWSTNSILWAGLKQEIDKKKVLCSAETPAQMSKSRKISNFIQKISFFLFAQRSQANETCSVCHALLSSKKMFSHLRGLNAVLPAEEKNFLFWWFTAQLNWNVTQTSCFGNDNSRCGFRNRTRRGHPVRRKWVYLGSGRQERREALPHSWHVL